MFQNTRTQILRPIADPRNNLQIPPPATPWSLETQEWYCNIFASFLKAVGPHKGELWHQLSAVPTMVMDSASTSIHGQILILSVAIGRVAVWGKDKLAKVVPVNSAEINALRKHICGAPVLQKSRDRALGFISGLARVRAQDVLVDLEARGQISSLLLRRWKEARNTAAHGSFREKDTADAISSDADVLLVLYYRMVMLITGYKGTLTDYSI